MPDSERTVYNLNVALGLVRQRLAEADIPQQCRRAGATHEAEGAGARITLPYFGQPHLIRLPEATVTPGDGAGELPLRERVLVLRYLAQAGGMPLTGRLITYRDLPSGLVYFPTFSRRTTEPLARYFGRTPEELVAASRELGGQPGTLGDTSVVIHPFPRVPLTLVLWHGDDEFPPDVKIMFDASITDYLEPEDVTVSCEIMTWRLVHYLRRR